MFSLVLSCKSDNNDLDTDEQLEIRSDLEVLPSPEITENYRGFQESKRSFQLDDTFHLSGLGVSATSAFLYALDPKTSSVKSYNYSSGKYTGAFIVDNLDQGHHLTTSGTTLAYRDDKNNIILDGELAKTMPSQLGADLRFVDLLNLDRLYEVGLDMSKENPSLYMYAVNGNTGKGSGHELMLGECFNNAESADFYFMKNHFSKNYYLLDITGAVLELDSNFVTLDCYKLPDMQADICGAAISSYGELLVLYYKENRNILTIF